MIYVNCLHLIDSQTYTKIPTNYASYKILATALLSFLQSIFSSSLTAVKDHVIKYNKTAFSNSNDNYFWSTKTLWRSSKGATLKLSGFSNTNTYTAIAFAFNEA